MMTRFRPYALLAALLLAAAPAVTAVAGDEDPTLEQVLDELKKTNQRMQKLEEQHEQDKQTIDGLNQRLQKYENGQAGRAPVNDRPTPLMIQPPPGALQQALGGLGGGGNLLNPEITVSIDMTAGISSDGDNDRVNRFSLREAEIDLRAAIAPFADGVLVVTIGEEIEDLEEGGIEVGTHVGVEEGYVHFHTLPLGLSAKAGKFRSAFGRFNQLHTHDLPQVTRPLAFEAFLGPEGLASTGAQLDLLLPNPLDLYILVTAEVINADGGEESPILGGPNAENPAYVAHIKFFQEVGENAWVEVGGSYLYGHTDADFDFDANVFGLDVTMKWIDPSAPDSRSFVWQSEFYWANNDLMGDDGTGYRNRSFGFYTYGQYQFARNWYGGVRFDYTEFPGSESRGTDDHDWAVSPYITYYLTEFLRLRFEYQHREYNIAGDWTAEDNFYVGLTLLFGAHPAHPYWVNR